MEDYYLSEEEIVDGRIYQGDIFEEFPCFVLMSPDYVLLREDETFSEGELPGGWNAEEHLIVRAKRFRIALLSQSCDIHEEGIKNLRLHDGQRYTQPFITYAPVVPVTELRELEGRVPNDADLARQNRKNAFYLPAHPSGAFPASAVILDWVCCLQKSRTNRFESFHPRRRLASLRSPYREALAHKFASLYSRVALPSDVTFVE